METKIRILLCDDSLAVHESLAAYLDAEHMDHVSVYDGEAALALLGQRKFDLLVLDIMLPGRFGTEICKEIRKTSSIPIILLSARSEEVDKVLGLELGADDYVTKPFSPRELVARIKTILRRAHPDEVPQTCITIGNLSINLEAYEVRLGSQPIVLTPKEIELLYYLASQQGKVLTREHLLTRVWGYDYPGDTRAVDTQVKRLRQKLGTGDLGCEIKAIYGVGYKMEMIG
jgi:DNA-binding response OmpR family regulator